MDGSYLVFIQPQVHNGAGETSVKQKTDTVRQAEHKSVWAKLAHGLNDGLPVNVGWNGLVRRLVHTADGQPNKALLPFN